MTPHEANLSTEQQKEVEDSRFSPSNEHDRRTECAQAAPASRTPSSLRIKGPNKARFEQIIKLGRRSNSQFVRLHALEGVGYLGIAVSRAVGSHARRNRARRRVREAWRQIPTPDGWDVVLMVKTSADAAAFTELAADLAKAKADLFAAPSSSSPSPA